MNPGSIAGISSSHKKMWFLAALTLLCYIPSFARLWVYALPLLSFLLAVQLIRKDKSAYIEFVVWLYMLVPLVRRYVDYRTGVQETTIMVAPYLAVAVCLWIIFPRWTEVLNARNASLILVLAAILYASATTAFQMLLGGLVSGVAAWLLNVLFAFFIVLERKHIKEMYVGFERVMVYGTLVVGAYGIVQYFLLPECDRVWMELSQLASFGTPLPLEVRVFSTMNAPQVVGAYLVVGILVAYGSHYKIKYLAMFAGLASLLLSMSRSAWVALVAGALFLAFRLPSRERKRIIVIGAICFGTILIGLQVPSLNESLSSRFLSLTDTNDDSAYDRTKIYEAVFHSVATSPFGLGLGVEDDSQSHDSIADAEHDSSVVNLLLSFGVVGSIVFCLGFVGVSWRILWASRDASSILLLSTQASLFALIAEVPLNNILTGPIASLTWCVIGLGCATMEARIDSWQGSFSDQLPGFAQPEEIF